LNRASAGGSSTRLEVVRAEDGHAEILAEFIRQVWDADATAASVLKARAVGAATNLAEPGIPPPTWIAVQHGKALGYVTTIPMRLWDGRQDWPAYWIKGLMVLPEVRGGPIGYLVLKAAIASLPRSGGLAVAPSARRLFEALGYRDLGAVRNWVRPITPRRILERIDLTQLGLSSVPNWTERGLRIARQTGIASAGGWAAGVMLRFAAAGRRLSAVGLETGPFDPTATAEELTELWSAVRGNLRSAVVRDAAYMVQRYPANRDSPYIWLGARRQGSLVGAVILRRPTSDGDDRLKGIHVATLADLIYQPDRPAVGIALLGAAERAARALRADAIAAMASSESLGTILRRQFYLPLAGTVHFLFREAAKEPASFSETLSDWWLTRGDGGADEGL
jgi:hypothetical protein